MFANSMSFLILNWSELIVLSIMLFKIRNVKDELNIKFELAGIIASWLFFSLVYYILSYVGSSKQNKEALSIKILILISILMRNISSLLISALSIYYTLHQKRGASPFQV